HPPHTHTHTHTHTYESQHMHASTHISYKKGVTHPSSQTLKKCIINSLLCFLFFSSFLTFSHSYTHPHILFSLSLTYTHTPSHTLLSLSLTHTHTHTLT